MVQTEFLVQFTGQLVPYAEGLRCFLLELGYTPVSATQLLRLARHLGRWLDRRSLRLSELTSTQAARFVRARRRAGHTQFVSTRSLRPILAFLASVGAIPPVTKPPIRQDLVGRYVEYLEQERGLSAPTIASHEHFTKRFLVAHPEVGRLTAADVTGFLLRESKQYAVGSVKVLTKVLRSFLRYLYVSDQVKIDLGGAVPAVAGWRLVGLPKALAPEDVGKILRSCDRRTAMGKRDFAILLLLTRLGLRACEVRSMLLDDIRWDESVIAVRGKGSVISELPLPADIGRALVAYLRVRGCPPTRSVFLRARAPSRGLGTSTVTQIVFRASKRVGLAPVFAHRLRHTVATEMLRRGGSLTEIASALRHRDADTTAIYAKVDTARLRMIARPWPGQRV
ncbi:MAG: integrase [Deltaproteobacteria bacterium]|nr:MAG: integrase [Deltaproteobacteria bacterium]TMQ09218.1 MAG: integrase [Deltaproteobacteria bacterium]